MADSTTNKILNIHVNFTEAVNGLVELKKKSEELNAKVKELKETFKADNDVNAYAKGMVEIEQKQKLVSDQTKKLTKAVQDELHQRTQEISSISAMTSKLQSLRQQYESLSEAERNGFKGSGLVQKMKFFSEEIKNATNAMKGLKFDDTSIEGMKARIASLTKEYSLLTQAQREDKAVGGALMQQIADESHKLKNAQDALKATTKVTAKYSDSVNGLRERLKEAQRKFDDMSAAMRKGADGQKLVAEIQKINKALKEAEESTGRFQRNVGNYKSALSGFKTWVLQFTLGLMNVGQAVIALGNKLKEGIDTAILFNREMSKLTAVLSGKDAVQDVSALAAEAKRLGAETRYTASQVGLLEIELAKLGYTQSQILLMTESTLKFAQAVGTDLASAAQLTGASLKMFEKTAMDTTEMVDKMALATSKSALSFEYIQTALPIVGSVANTFNFTIEETLGLLGQLANSGFNASMAATATRNIFLRLADANGVLAKQLGYVPKNIDELADGLITLREKGVNLADTLEMTDRRSVAAFNAFLRTAKGAKELANELSNANGTTEQMAKTMEDNLGGSITALSSAWDDFCISLNGNQGILRDAVDWIRDIVKGMGDIIRSADEIQARKNNQKTKDLSVRHNPKSKDYDKIEKSYLDPIVDQDVADYNKLKEEYIKQGKSVAEAQQAAYDVIYNRAKEDEARYRAFAEKAAEQRRKLQAKIDRLNNLKVTEGTSKKDIEELGKLKEYEEQLAVLQEMEAERTARANAQRARLDYVDRETDERVVGNGLGIEDDAARNKRLSREKSAEKALLDAVKTYNQSVINLTKEGEDARLLEINRNGIKVIQSYKDEMEKEKSIIENKYNNEIAQLQYKINEELKMRGDESAKEREDKLAAIDIYNKAIKKKEEERSTELLRLQSKYIVQSSAKMKELYDAQLSAYDAGAMSGNGTNADITAEYDIKRKKLEEEQKAELAQLELSASKDAVIAEQKGQRELAIRSKYSALILQSYRDEVKEKNDILYNNMNTALTRENDEVKRAQIEANLKLQIYKNFVRQKGETDEEYNLRYAKAEMDAFEASDALKNAQIENALTLRRLSQGVIKNDLQQARFEKEQAEKRVEFLRARGKLETQTIEQYSQEMTEAEQQKHDATMKFFDAEFAILERVANVTSEMFGTISQAISDCMDETEENVRLAKILGLAEVYIAQGVAIANAIKDAAQSSSSAYEVVAQIAIGVAAVVSSTVQAISSIKSAKFAKGGVNIQGAGTGTSDSINAKISNGESVMTAKATERFGALLQIMNKVATQPSYTLPTMYSTTNPAQSAVDANYNNNALRDAVQDIHPVVSVKEITKVSNRVKAIETLDTF